jgi:PAS domain S-box-containing protein
MPTLSRSQIDEQNELALALNDLSCAVSITDTYNKFVYVNQAFTLIYGWTSGEILGLTPGLLVPRLQAARWLDDFKREVLKPGGWVGRVVNVTKSGVKILVSLRTFAVRPAKRGGPTFFIGLSSLNEDLREAECELVSRLASVSLARGIELKPLSVGRALSRQLQVCRLKALGYHTKDIAVMLGISASTVNVALFRERRKSAPKVTRSREKSVEGNDCFQLE